MRSSSSRAAAHIETTTGEGVQPVEPELPRNYMPAGELGAAGFGTSCSLARPTASYSLRFNSSRALSGVQYSVIRILTLRKLTLDLFPILRAAGSHRSGTSGPSVDEGRFPQNDRDPTPFHSDPAAWLEPLNRLLELNLTAASTEAAQSLADGSIAQL